MILIYILSSQANSGVKTNEMISKILPGIKEPSIIETINYIIRKTAHLTEYFILTLLINSLLKEYTLKEKTRLLLSIAICFIYSMTDEIHQSFIQGRTGIFTDCLIDTLGGIIYIAIYKIKKLSHQR